jgi:hypothetical protein
MRAASQLARRQRLLSAHLVLSKSRYVRRQEIVRKRRSDSQELLMPRSPLPVLVTLGLVGCSGAGASYTATAASAPAPPSDGPRHQLESLIVDVTLSDGFVYNAHDDAGHSMDTAKIIPDPAGGFIAVYHTLVNGQFKVNLATSPDLLDWTWVRELAGSNSGSASQPTILQSGDAFVMAWEQEPRNHLKLSYFNSRDDLMAGAVAKSYEAPMVLSSCANGTPNLYAANSERVDVGFHYFDNCVVDRQARGIVTWDGFSASAQHNFDNALLYWGVKGNIGDRDGYLDFEGFNFGVIEGQFVNGDFGSFRTFVFDYQTGNADPLPVRTHGGSRAFANPTFTIVTVDGVPAIVTTLFLPSEGAAAGEAGELIYFRKLR